MCDKLQSICTDSMNLSSGRKLIPPVFIFISKFVFQCLNKKEKKKQNIPSIAGPELLHSSISALKVFKSVTLSCSWVTCLHSYSLFLTMSQCSKPVAEISLHIPGKFSEDLPCILHEVKSHKFLMYPTRKFDLAFGPKMLIY